MEKVLKAFWVRDNEEEPPYIHNLLKLAEKTQLNLSDKQIKFLRIINTFNIEARYPDYKQQFYKICDRKFTEDKFSKIKEVYLWLLKQI